MFEADCTITIKNILVHKCSCPMRISSDNSDPGLNYKYTCIMLTNNNNNGEVDDKLQF